MKVKYVGIFLLLIFIFTVFVTVDASADIFEVAIPCSYDGTVTYYYVTSACTRDDTNTYNIAQHWGYYLGSQKQKKAFFEWDISAIPPKAIILNMGITLKGAGSVQGVNCETSYMFNCTVRPSDEIDNTPGNKNIFDAHDITANSIFRFKGDCDRPLCGPEPCPYPSTTINTINTTMGGDYWFADFDTDNKAIQSLQENLALGYYAIIYIHPYNIADSPAYSYYYGDDSVYMTPELWVEYEVVGPSSNYSSPDDFETGVGWNSTGIDLTFNLSHPDGQTMSMTWFAYNESSETFVVIGSNLTITNGTYNQTWYDNNYTVFTDGFQPCTTYYWKIESNDSLGNESIFYREFTTYCIEPPTNLDFNRIDNDTINITWTKMDNYTGVSNTTIYYTVGGLDYPDWGEGIFLCNTSSENFTANLDEATCYAFSAWTMHNTSTGTWYRSINRDTISICTEGGDFILRFRDEDTFEYLNFSRYPWNSSIFRIKIHYADDYDQYDIGNLIMGHETKFNINTPSDIFYLELYVHYDYADDSLGYGKCGRAQYVRKLLPSAAVDKTFTFYVANYTVYNEYFFCMNTSGALEQYLDSSFQDSVVKYIYEFEDRTHVFDSVGENDAYIEIYSFNQSVRYIVHQEFWDAAKKVYPHLIFEKGYLVKIGLISDTTTYALIGLAPVHEIINERVVIQASDENISYLLNEIISISAAWSGNVIHVVYSDSNFQTTSITCTIHDLDGVEVYTKTVDGFSEYTFITLVLDTTKVYEITLTITHPEFIGIYGSSVVPLTFPLLPGVTALTDVSIFNNLITPILGLAPFHNPTTGEYIGWFEMGALILVLGTFGLLINLNPPLAILITGIEMVGISALVSGFVPAVGGVGIIMAILGFWYFLSEWRSGAY